MLAALLLLAVAGVAAGGTRPPRHYATDASRSIDAPLNVHIVCHSHDDSGWLKTVDQYYYGANNTIQVAGVQYILDTVVQALAANPHRKFIYSEMSFFMRWWDQQDDDTRALVSKLVGDSQLEFVNGGYVQHDEATAHYVAMVDQTTLGHTFLRKTFGVVPRVGWQIDPFGHSATQAGLLSAQVGFDALFFGRADYQDMEHRRNLTAMEVVWQGSGSLADATVFTGNFPSGNYGPPTGFAYEWGDPPLMDDPRLAEYNVQERVDAFVERCGEQAAVTRGNDIMLTIGSDFQFANAHMQFKNLDKLIHHVNADGRINAFYSTPTQYASAKHSYGERWPLKQDDFFPYADFPHALWTGYFTSRPASKAFIRGATSYLQAARQLEASLGRPDPKQGGPTTDALEEAVALMQHHDAVTGTAKQHVVNDYHQRLHSGLKEAQGVVMSGLERLIRGEYRPTRSGSGSSSDGNAHRAGEGDGSWAPSAAAATASQRRLQENVQGDAHLHVPQGQQGQQGPNPVDGPLHLEVCDWLNITACSATVHLSSAGKGILVAAYNPLGWSREAVVRVPVSTATTCGWAVTGPEGEQVAAQLLPVPPSTLALQQLMATVNATCPMTFADAEVSFVARLPPVGYSTFMLQPSEAASGGGCTSTQASAGRAAAASASSAPAAAGQQGEGSKARAGMHEGEEGVLDNGLVRLEFDTHTGLLSSMSAGGVSAKLSTHFAWYNASDGLDSQENRGQGSGAYIFRPNGLYNVSGDAAGGSSLWRGLWQRLGLGGSSAQPAVKLDIVARGNTVWEARQVFGDWATLVTRLYRGQSHAEVEWTVGPIPFEDGLGKEVVLAYSSDVDSGDEFWTDSNGREMIKRVRDFRPTWELNQTEAVAGNYYPLTAAMYIQDQQRQLAVLTERAQGGASLRSGHMEVMVHRRILSDDMRGVDEPLNETACGCTKCNCPGLVVRGRHWLVLSPREEAAKPRRTLQQELNDPPLLAFAPIPHQIGSLQGGRIGLRREFSLSEGHILHSNVHLLTLKDTGSSYLVRLAHLYQAGEDPGLSQPTTENLNAMLQLLHYQAIRELSLSGNQLRSDMQRRRLRFDAGDSLSNGTVWMSNGAGEGGSGAGALPGVATAGAAGEEEDARLRAGAQVIDCSSGCSNGELLVTLQPMEVRTFELIYRPT